MIFCILSSLAKLNAEKPPNHDAWIMFWHNWVINNYHSNSNQNHVKHKHKKYNLFLKYKSIKQSNIYRHQ